MKRVGSAKLYVSVSLLLPAACLFIWRTAWWPIVVFVVWSAITIVLWVHSERKEQRDRQARLGHALQTSAIRTLNHHRHDWMNDLQVLYGYIRMNKQDKAVQCVEGIRERMIAESRIAKLGVPSLVTYLQSFRTMTHSMQLHVVIDGELDMEEIPIDKNGVAETLIDIMNVYRFGMKQSTGEPAKLTLQMARDNKSLHAVFFYDGEWNDIEDSMHKIKQRLKNSPLQPISSEQSLAELPLKAELRG
ncbi:Spo0B domain-containing protein [Paenibacillus sp. MMS18-CY102]|uniref:Spo0B domain-containing protein n=1 Tax=Paenibacillus sp. MMS18-CY102 TaxID=2682849 RepID=UPI0013666FD0|nr:Spo0B domain-containing protein [Paenibacillus sp. MMS18-CY102]MWC28763.1 histidine kinase [Paenibacillus sp. MMS18-CY102]